MTQYEFALSVTYLSVMSMENQNFMSVKAMSRKKSSLPELKKKILRICVNTNCAEKSHL